LWIVRIVFGIVVITIGTSANNHKKPVTRVIVIPVIIGLVHDFHGTRTKTILASAARIADATGNKGSARYRCLFDGDIARTVVAFDGLTILIIIILLDERLVAVGWWRATGKRRRRRRAVAWIVKDNAMKPADGVFKGVAKTSDDVAGELTNALVR